MATVIQESFTLCLYVYPMCALDNCEICQKICYSAATLQAHMMFHIRKDATNQIFYKCDRCTITFKGEKKSYYRILTLFSLAQVVEKCVK